MKITITALLLLAAAAPVLTADTIARWTFESSKPTTAGPISPEEGAGSGTSLHAAAATAYSNPAGNGSTESWSSNNWAVGDYYQFQVSTLGYEDITLSWDQTRSRSGPNRFELLYRTDISSWSVFDSYTVGNITWSSTVTSGLPFSFDLSAISGLNSKSNVYFQLRASSSPTDTAGTSRVDNFTVSGTAIQSVPEGAPGVAGLAAACILMAAFRPRRAR